MQHQTNIDVALGKYNHAFGRYYFCPVPSKCPCGICKRTVASNHRAISAMTVMTGFTSDVGILHLLNTTDYN